MKQATFTVITLMAFACAPAMARDVFPMNANSGEAQDWFLSASGVLSFADIVTELDFDQNGATPDLYETIMPEFQIFTPGTDLGLNPGDIKQYDIATTAGNDRLIFKRPDNGMVLAEFKVVDITSMTVFFGSTAEIDTEFGFDLDLLYVDPDATAVEGQADYWTQGFSEYIGQGGADIVISLTLTAGNLTSAIDNGRAITNGQQTAASFSMTPNFIPEPTSIALISGGLAALALRRRKRA